MSESTAKAGDIIVLPADAAKLSDAQGKKIVTIAGAFAGLGALLCIVAAMVDLRRFAFSYLTGFIYVITIGLGALFFVLLQHVTKAGWSVAARRHMEWVMQILPVGILLFIPVALLAHYTHGAWWAGAEALKDELLAKKASWLNPTAFYIRALIYFGAWSFLVWWFGSKSRAQDVSGDPELTRKMQLMSGPMILIFALTLTFGVAFDWVMSLQPHWFSTIFGVYIFAGSVTSSLAVLCLLTIAMQGAKLFKRVSNVEHRHLIGKLMFAFTTFWAYVSFSQFILIWYANLPEETVFFHHRWVGSWQTVSMLLLFGHFIVPFLFLLSRHPKRNMTLLAIGAIIMLVAHYIDLYWLVMPILDPSGANPSWIDLAGLLGPVGILGLVVALKAAKGPLYPLKDPRLGESMRSENAV